MLLDANQNGQQRRRQFSFFDWYVEFTDSQFDKLLPLPINTFCLCLLSVTQLDHLKSGAGSILDTSEYI